jgi:hypothetical protein
MRPAASSQTEDPLELRNYCFETLSRTRVPLGDRIAAQFDGLIHPVHRRGAASKWSLFVPHFGRCILT